MTTIYILLLSSNKYYIGRTTRDINIRFEEHVAGNGSEWTKIYRPEKMIETYISDSPFKEDEITKQYMMKYGIDNVRGGSYTKVVLDDWQVKSLKHEFKTISDQCFICGDHVHFACNCNSLYKKYLDTFDTEEKISVEIDKMETFREILLSKKNDIMKYKTITRRVQKNVLETEEITPYLIDKYELRKYKYIEDINSIPIVHEFIARIKWLKESDNIKNTQNIIEMLYKIYIHRRKLEKYVKELIIVSGCKFRENYDDVLTEVNNKIEMLYEKYANMFV